MEWYLALLFCVGILILFFTTGLPIAFCFIAFNIIGMLIFFGGESSLQALILSMTESAAKFMLLPIPLFLLLGSMLFNTGIAARMIDVLNSILGRLPGRLSVIAVIGGTILATMGGSTSASASLLATTLLPEMQRCGYKKPMILGPIMGSGVLAAIIPPSGQAVLLGGLASISIAQMLIGGIIPGLIMAGIYIIYIVGRCIIQPELAPVPCTVPGSPAKKAINFLLYVAPLGLIFILTIGPIFVGVATPTEAAAIGTLGIFVLAVIYRKLTWEATKKSAINTARIATMLFTILLGSAAFSQILAFSGAAGGISRFVTGLQLSPFYVHVLMLLVVFFMGCFMDITSIMMITIPIFLPIVHASHINPLWWGITMNMVLEIGTITPPFGVILFAMRGLMPPDMTIEDLYKGTVPFIICDLIGVAIVMAFPILATWLPLVMTK